MTAGEWVHPRPQAIRAGLGDGAGVGIRKYYGADDDVGDSAACEDVCEDADARGAEAYLIIIVVIVIIFVIVIIIFFFVSRS